MTDPILASFLANLTSELAEGVISVLIGKLKTQFESPSYRVTLARCYQVDIAALLPTDPAGQAALRPVL